MNTLRAFFILLACSAPFCSTPKCFACDLAHSFPLTFTPGESSTLVVETVGNMIHAYVGEDETGVPTEYADANPIAGSRG